MILDKNKLKKATVDSGASLDGLASSLIRPGLNERSALAAMRNWTRGKSSPKPKMDDIRSLANALGVAPKTICQFDASHNWAHISARKARLVVDLIRGEDIDTALSMIRFSKKRAAVLVGQVLNAAIASAEENDADVTRLRVSISKVDEGPTVKRWQPKDRGRAHQILKRTSHIKIAVEEC